MMNLANSALPNLEDKCQELRALARILTYANETAISLDADAAAFCIEAALNAISEQLSGNAERISGLCQLNDSKTVRH